MTESAFSEKLSGQIGSGRALSLENGDKVVILSDLHMGDGGRGDDLVRNEGLLIDALELWYLPRDYVLVLNGDIEELQGFSLAEIRSRWKRLYDLFDRFAARGALYKTVGNHDDGLLFEENYPYPLINALKIETGVLPVYVYHGHQGSQVYSRYNGILHNLMRYLMKPLGIRNISAARRRRRRFAAERSAYDFSRRNGIVSIIGHTHRPLFESLARFDYIKFEIERLCRVFPAATGEERAKIEGEVHALRFELAKLKRKERRRSLQDTLYGDELPVPCLFNSGSAIGKKGINAIELDRERISLVYWYTEGAGKHFVSRGGYLIEEVAGGKRKRAVLNSDALDYVLARISLLS